MKELEINKKVKYFLLFMMFAPLIGLFGWMFWGVITDNKTFEESFLEREKEIECIGKLDSIYRQKMNHNILTLRTNNCVFEVASNWENKFKVGDSISKKKGELIVEHYRNGELIEILDIKL